MYKINIIHRAQMKKTHSEDNPKCIDKFLTHQQALSR